MLKAILESVDDLPDPLKEHYTQGDDGKYVLTVEAVGGYALENVEGLKSALGKERTTREGLERTVVKFKDIDPDKAREALAKLEELATIDPKKEADKLASERLEAAKKQLLEKHGGEISTRDERIGHLTKTVEGLLIDSVATEAIVAAKGSVKLLLKEVRDHCRVKEVDGKFSVEVVDKDGNVKIADAKGTPMDIKGLVAEMRGDPEYGRAFDASGNTGTGKAPTTPSNGTGGTGQLKRGQMTVRQKADYIAEHGQEAFLKLPK